MQVIRQLRRKDVREFRQLIRIFMNVFEAPARIEPDEAYLAKLLENPAFVVIAALNGNDIIGGLTAYELPGYYSEQSELFLYDIAVRQELQQTGIGKSLIAALRDYCRDKDIREMFVAANEEDVDAVRFYHATGGQPLKAVHFSYMPTGTLPR